MLHGDSYTGNLTCGEPCALRKCSDSIMRCGEETLSKQLLLSRGLDVEILSKDLPGYVF